MTIFFSLFGTMARLWVVVVSGGWSCDSVYGYNCPGQAGITQDRSGQPVGSEEQAPASGYLLHSVMIAMSHKYL